MKKYRVRFDNGDMATILADEYRVLDYHPELSFYRHEKKKCDCGCNCNEKVKVATFNPEVVSVWLIE